MPVLETRVVIGGLLTPVIENCAEFAEAVVVS